MDMKRSTWAARLATAFNLVAIAVLPAHAENAPARSSDSARVLVVVNSNSDASEQVAQYYRARRGIDNFLRISCSDAALSPENESIKFTQYTMQIERPIRAYLKAHPKIDFIVLTKGIPIRISRPQIPGSRLDFYSLDSRLAALGYGALPASHRVDIRDTHYDESYVMQYHHNFHGKAWANNFWNSTTRFSHARFGGYLVTRLDGYSVSDAEALVDRALQAEQLISDGGRPAGPILLNMAPKFGLADKASQPYSIVPSGIKNGAQVEITSEDARLADFNSDMEHAAEQLSVQGFEVEIEKTGEFIGNRRSLMAYVSWGSNDSNFKPDLYHSLEFSPGSIAETAVSTSARTFFHANLGQSLVADLITQGATGAKGYTDEPLIQAVAQPSILLDRYTRGWTLAESYYAASHLLGWQDIVLGDPIARAYPVKPQ